MFCLSQRAEHIWEAISSATTRSRPIINTRDEPHADPEKFRRLHVIVGDSNMSEYATFLKVGTTSILLAMFEDSSTVLRDLTLENPIRAIREISHDITCQRRVRLANGREMRALDIQAEYLERALKFRDRKGLSPRRTPPSTCGSTASRASRPIPPPLWRECDWVAKYRLVEQMRARHDVPLIASQGRHDRSHVPRRRPRPRPVLQAPEPGPDRAHVHRRRDRRRHDAAPEPRGPGCGGPSSSGPRNGAATSPSTGCTSS